MEWSRAHRVLQGFQHFSNCEILKFEGREGGGVWQNPQLEKKVQDLGNMFCSFVDNIWDLADSSFSTEIINNLFILKS